jgi:cytochrome c oxidase assembly protein subunit 15
LPFNASAAQTDRRGTFYVPFSEAFMRPLVAYDHPLRGAIAKWVFLLAAMTAGMVLIGGLTRLTEAGLSIVVWQPLIGAIPPLNDDAWQQAFAQYQQYPEYQVLNYGMTLVEFKRIFWTEYFHRLLGRALGIVFLIPFAIFLIKGAFKGTNGRLLTLRLLGVFALGGVQAFLGWFMVSSGLEDRPEVSAYRLALHLSVGLLVFLSLLAIAIILARRPMPSLDEVNVARRLKPWAARLLCLAFVTVIAGAFVAGNHAGLTYNTFPLMDGKLVPDGYLLMQPLWHNFFENVATVQFDHRVLGVVTGLSAIALCLLHRKMQITRKARVALYHVGAMGLIQPALGITALVTVVPVPLALLHQAGAVALLSSVLWYRIELSTTARHS